MVEEEPGLRQRSRDVQGTLKENGNIKDKNRNC